MTKYLDSAPFMVPPPAKEFKPERPTNLYADRFPELVDEQHDYSEGGGGLCRTCGHASEHRNHAKSFSPHS